MKGMIERIHQRYVQQRRVQILARHLSEFIEPQAMVLDVGAGDGLLAATLASQRSDLSVKGIDVLVRPDTSISVSEFDGNVIPFEDQHFDAVLLMDVLHHTHHPSQLLCEAARVAKKQIIIKDHYLQGILAQPTLQWMDHVGNARHGVAIPCNYLTVLEWDQLFIETKLHIAQIRKKLGLYLPPLNLFFERNLHFMAELRHANQPIIQSESFSKP